MSEQRKADDAAEDRICEECGEVAPLDNDQLACAQRGCSASVCTKCGPYCEEHERRCEGCRALATCIDNGGVPLCEKCARSLEDVSPQAAQGDEPDVFVVVARELSGAWPSIDSLAALLRERFGPIVNQLQGARDHLKYETNSVGGIAARIIVARIDRALASLSSRAAGGVH